MDGKIILLLTSVIAVGMFVLPSTMALYTGQHDFVDGENVECGKCHVASKDLIAQELENGSVHEGMGCGGCHGGDAGLVDTRGNVTDGEVTAHAAGIGINCIGCHGSANVTTNRDGQVNVSYELELSTSAHKYLTFNTTGDATGDINDKDLVCVACHTRVNVDLINVSLTPDTGVNITIEGGGDGNWTYDHID